MLSARLNGTLCASVLIVTVFCLLMTGGRGLAQDATAKLSEAQIEQLVAPVALHPDALVSQILMASTYPLEVVEAQRWVKANPGVTGDALENAMQKQSWDESVKSLTAFPQVLDMMNEQLSWTQQVGDAFLAQQEDVFTAIQTLRAKADAEGNLESTKEQKVTKQANSAQPAAAPAGGTSSGGAYTPPRTVYVIEPADPEIVYVPAYDPTVVYGGWAYPSYPPYYWYPAGYVASRALWFGAGVAAGYALWGEFDWRHGDVDINVNRYNKFNNTNITNNHWEHNSVHRKGVPYRDRDVADRFGHGRNDARAQAREQFRGRADSERRDLASIKPGDIKKPDLSGKRPGLGDKRPDLGDKRPDLGGKKPGLAGKKPNVQRPAAKPKPKPKVASRPQVTRPKAPQRPSTPHISRPAQAPAAFRNMGSGARAQQFSARGHASRSIASHGGGGRHVGGGGHRGGGRRR